METLTFPKELSGIIGGPDGPANLVMDLAKPEEAEEIFDFALQHVYSTPVMRSIFQVTDGDIHQLRSTFGFWLQIIRQALTSHSYSLVIRDRATNQLVAISVGTVLHRKDYDPIPMGEDLWIARAIAVQLFGGVDLFARFQTDRICDLGPVAVHPNYRRFGLYSMMYKASADLAVRDGIFYGKGTAMGLKAALGPLSLGYEIVSSVDVTTVEHQGVRPLAGLKGPPDDPPALYLVAGPLVPRHISSKMAK